MPVGYYNARYANRTLPHRLKIGLRLYDAHAMILRISQLEMRAVMQ